MPRITPEKFQILRERAISALTRNSLTRSRLTETQLNRFVRQLKNEGYKDYHISLLLAKRAGMGLKEMAKFLGSSTNAVSIRFGTIRAWTGLTRIPRTPPRKVKRIKAR